MPPVSSCHQIKQYHVQALLNLLSSRTSEPCEDRPVICHALSAHFHAGRPDSGGSELTFLAGIWNSELDDSGAQLSHSDRIKQIIIKQDATGAESDLMSEASLNSAW